MHHIQEHLPVILKKRRNKIKILNKLQQKSIEMDLTNLLKFNVAYTYNVWVRTWSRVTKFESRFFVLLCFQKKALGQAQIVLCIINSLSKFVTKSSFTKDDEKVHNFYFYLKSMDPKVVNPFFKLDSSASLRNLTSHTENF